MSKPKMTPKNAHEMADVCDQITTMLREEGALNDLEGHAVRLTAGQYRSPDLDAFAAGVILMDAAAQAHVHAIVQSLKLTGDDAHHSKQRSRAIISAVKFAMDFGPTCTATMLRAVEREFGVTLEIGGDDE